MFYYRLNLCNELSGYPHEEERSGIVNGASFQEAVKNLEDWYDKSIISINDLSKLDPLIEITDFKDIFPDL